MRATVAALLVAVGVILGTPLPARAAATAVCTITDGRVVGVSGLVVTADGFIGVSDSNYDASKVRVWYLDRHCRVVRSLGYPTPAYDPEDAALGRDGTLYVADIGDNDRTRRTIAVWRLAPGGPTPKIYRYAYPDGPHDAEAILLAADDTPIFVTKDPVTAGIYVPTGPADPSGHPVRLRKAGTFTLTPTDTGSGVGVLGGFVVTGGANSPDRRRVVLRSYTDAYLWEVPAGGDVVATITSTRPVITPLPNEPQGESIAFSADGTSYYTVSDQETPPIRTRILRYLAPPLPRASPTRSGRAGGAPVARGATSSAADTGSGGGAVVVAVAGVTLLLLAGAGVVVARRARR
jgi:hypothetical protein